MKILVEVVDFSPEDVYREVYLCFLKLQ
jgi:hypothetical protein